MIDTFFNNKNMYSVDAYAILYYTIIIIGQGRHVINLHWTESGTRANANIGSA